MGCYGERILPRLVDIACGTASFRPLRRRACAGLHGHVVEIGFGSGHNVSCYPAAVTEVTAIEPADRAWALAADRIADAAVPVHRAGLDGARLPLADGSCQTALSTWTMCTIADISGALGELHRVLEPGGTLHFAEHGLAPDPAVQRWQRRLEPLQRRVFGGCHLTRRIGDLILAAGFELVEREEFYEPGAPRSFSALTVGVACRT
jgi:SAM-dependent methyltransferase